MIRHFFVKHTMLREVTALGLAYVLLGSIVFLPLVTHLRTHILADDVFIEPGRSDAYNFLWTYWWIQKAAVTGHNIYQCDWVFPPTGANLYFHTHVILPTLLTLPLGAALGPVGGYNSMIILLLSAAALIYAVFLRRTFGLGLVASFIAGAFFGFCPYFVFKTHAHVNLVGGVFWGGALAVLVHAYVKRQFDWRGGVLFALCLWATFWTSFVELFALLVTSALTVLVFELVALARTRRIFGWRRLAFFSLSLPGALSLLSLRNAPDVHAVDIGPFADVQLSDLLIPARLSFFGGAYNVSEFEYWGSHVPVVFLLTALVALAARRFSPAALSLLLMAAIAAVLTLDPGGLPLSLVRKLPLGTGFRVAGRFLPFFYFFALIASAFGIQRLLALQNPVLRGGALALLALLSWLELYPAQLSPSPVKRLELPAQIVAEHARTLIIPRGPYTNALDTYQVSMNVPVVHLSYLAREDPATVDARKQRFPALYPNPHKLTARVLKQMKEADVRYVLFEDKAQYDASKLHGEPILERDGAILVRY